MDSNNTTIKTLDSEWSALFRALATAKSERELAENNRARRKLLLDAETQHPGITDEWIRWREKK